MVSSVSCLSPVETRRGSSQTVDVLLCRAVLYVGRGGQIAILARCLHKIGCMFTLLHTHGIIDNHTPTPQATSRSRRVQEAKARLRGCSRTKPGPKRSSESCSAPGMRLPAACGRTGSGPSAHFTFDANQNESIEIGRRGLVAAVGLSRGNQAVRLCTPRFRSLVGVSMASVRAVWCGSVGKTDEMLVEGTERWPGQGRAGGVAALFLGMHCRGSEAERTCIGVRDSRAGRVLGTWTYRYDQYQTLH